MALRRRRASMLQRCAGKIVAPIVDRDLGCLKWANYGKIWGKYPCLLVFEGQRAPKTQKNRFFVPLNTPAFTHSSCILMVDCCRGWIGRDRGIFLRIDSHAPKSTPEGKKPSAEMSDEGQMTGSSSGASHEYCVATYDKDMRKHGVTGLRLLTQHR